ncbi:hypothetical protein BKA83DRAFT_4507063 [Pisolithus microcarpus]|nr:hypothetical protein BKA83DRAFT_4507063 [Pisolithus microcarpus]
MQAREKAFTQANILEAWRRTGIHPFNPDIFSAADYAPSNVSSTSDQLPTSYPADFPLDGCTSSSESDDPDYDPTSSAKPLARESDTSDSDSSEGFNSMSSSSEVCQEDDCSGTGVRKLVSSVGPISLSQLDDLGPSAAPTVKSPHRTHSMTSSHPTAVSRTASIRSVSISRSATPLSGATSSHSRLSSAKEAEYQEEIARLRAENEEMRWQRDTAQSHAVMLRRDYNLLKEQLNTKAAQASRKTRGVRQHGLMTSAESRKRIAEEEEKRAAKRRKVEAGKQRRQEKAAVVQAQRNAMDGTEVYKGRLTSKNKTELENIALALGFTADDLKTTKNDLISTSLKLQFRAMSF